MGLSEQHEAAVQQLVVQGCRVTGFRRMIHGKLRQYGFDITDIEVPIIPDAFKDYGHEVHVFEVVHTNMLKDYKLRQYGRLWFALDSLIPVHLRLFSVGSMGGMTEHYLGAEYYRDLAVAHGRGSDLLTMPCGSEGMTDEAR